MNAKLSPRRAVRQQWQQHPNFPDHVLLVGSHDNFRRVSELIRGDLALETVPRYAQRLFRRWMMAMSSHERYEETKLYPYLSHRWGACMDHLREGHELLHARRAEVYAAFDAVIESGDQAGADGDRLRAAYERFHEVLVEHLDLEEQTVVPLLLDLKPSEFSAYTMHDIEHLLRTTAHHAAG